MRCRKARSLLSAASSDELSGRRLLAVREHLSGCAACRREAAMYASLRQATKELAKPKMADDFNTRLLNRIAQERFAETRTKAHLPRRYPGLTWRVLAPATTAVVFALTAAAVLIMMSGEQPGPAQVRAPAPMDDSYLSVQPINNPNLAARRVARNMGPDWSLTREVVKAERLDRLTQRLTNRYGFANFYDFGSMVRSVAYDSALLPVGRPMFGPLPQGVRVYRAGTVSNTEGVSRAY